MSAATETDLSDRKPTTRCFNCFNHRQLSHFSRCGLPFCRYVLTIIDEARKIAIGGVLVYRKIADALDGTEENGNAAGTESSLISDLVYVAAMDNLTLAYNQGYESGFKPGNFTGVSLLQYLADEDSYYWTIDADGVYPRSVDIRLFVDLGSQPVVVTLEPDFPWPVPDVELPGTTFSGSECCDLLSRRGSLRRTNPKLIEPLNAAIPSKYLAGNATRLGLDWNSLNFNNTPNM